VTEHGSSAAGATAGHPLAALEEPLNCVALDFAVKLPVELVAMDDEVTPLPLLDDSPPLVVDVVPMQSDGPSAGPEANPPGYPQPVCSCVPQPQTSSIALHSGLPGAGFSTHCPFASQLPIAK
jgi:hypothetical protein